MMDFHIEWTEPGPNHAPRGEQGATDNTRTQMPVVSRGQRIILERRCSRIIRLTERKYR